MVNNLLALNNTRVLVTLYGIAIAQAAMIPSIAVGVPGAITDVVGVQRADLIGAVTHAGVTYDVLETLSVVVEVATLPAGLVVGVPQACTATAGAALLGIALAPVQPTAADLVAIRAGAASFGAQAANTFEADGVLTNFALGVGGQMGAGLLATSVPAGATVVKGNSSLERLAHVAGLALRTLAIVWIMYVIGTWLWARRPAILRRSSARLGWGRA